MASNRGRSAAVITPASIKWRAICPMREIVLSSARIKSGATIRYRETAVKSPINEPSLFSPSARLSITEMMKSGTQAISTVRTARRTVLRSFGLTRPRDSSNLSGGPPSKISVSARFVSAIFGKSIVKIVLRTKLRSRAQKPEGRPRQPTDSGTSGSWALNLCIAVTCWRGGQQYRKDADADHDNPELTRADPATGLGNLPPLVELLEELVDGEAEGDQ